MNKENDIGKKIKELRQYIGLTQEELAEKCNIDSKHLSKIENGLHLPNYNTLKKLTDYLNFDLYNNNIVNKINSNNALYLKSIKILNSAENYEEIKFFYDILKLAQKGLLMKK